MAKTDNRLFAPFPIEMDEHPKIAPLSDAAFRALFEATFYSRRMLSDGFLDERIVLKRWGQAVADELSTNDPKRPSWNRVDGGWQVHDFDKHHPLKADIEAGRERLSEVNREKGRLSGLARRTKAEQIANQIEPDVNRERTESNSETETETETTPKGVKARKRATQVPTSFPITAEMRQWASTETPLVDLDRKLPEFIDYWRGTGLVKQDWIATWRNGMRKQQEFALRNAPDEKPKAPRRVER